MPQLKAPEYDFSIAATPWTDTATVPQGALVLPGRYTVRLTVDGVVSEQPLEVLLDPRSDVAREALEEQAALQRDVYAALAQATDAVAAADAAIAKLATAPQAAVRPVRDALAKAASNL